MVPESGQHVTLREHYDALRAADKERLDAALKAVEKATEVLAEAYKTDKAAANEWRATINDILAMQRGSKTGLKETLAWITGVLGAIAIIYSFFKGQP